LVLGVLLEHQVEEPVVTGQTVQHWEPQLEVVAVAAVLQQPVPFAMAVLVVPAMDQVVAEHITAAVARQVMAPAVRDQVMDLLFEQQQLIQTLE
jgi:hypothetical protein